MPKFQTYHQSKQNQQKSSNSQTDEIQTLPSTPENFRFFSIKKLFDDDSKSTTKSKNQEELNQDQTFPSYRSFTDIMANEIKALIKKEKQVEEVESKAFEGLIQRFQLIQDEYFQSVFALNFSYNSLSAIFGRQKMTFGPSKIEKTLEMTDCLSISEKTALIQQITKNQKVVKFLQIIGRQLPHQVNFEFVYVTNQILKNNEKRQLQKVGQDSFYDPRIRYINFRVTNTQVSNEELKTFFLTFIRKFSDLILESNQQNHERYDSLVRQNSINFPSLKRIKLYSSKSDFFRSEDENDGEIIFAPKKKMHF